MAENAKNFHLCIKLLPFPVYCYATNAPFVVDFFDLLHCFILNEQGMSFFLTQTLYTREDDCIAWLFFSDMLSLCQGKLFHRSDALRQLSPYRSIIVARELTSQTTCPLIRWNSFLRWFFQIFCTLWQGDFFTWLVLSERLSLHPDST